jgi:phosphate transport system substrate-binding protein
MNRRHALSLLTLAAVCAGPIGCNGSDDVTIQGSGATFPAPVYKRWFLEFYKQHHETRVNYTAIGSGAGIRQFSYGLVLFGASDAGMSGKEIEALPADYQGVHLLPMTAGSIVLSYNVPGVDQPIKLSRKAYLGIFLREITSWDDDEIRDHNKGVKLPHLAITVVARADSSGTTDVFTHHLYAVGQDPRVGLTWSKDDVGKSIRWKESIAAQGNDGVAALIQLTPGAIGYLEFGYAELAHLPRAILENKAGAFVEATPESGKIALAEGKIPEKDLQIKIPDPVGSDAYPIVTYTWIIVRRHYPRELAREAEAFKRVLEYCISDEGQEIAEQLYYIRLPPNVVEAVRKTLDKIDIEK